MHGCWFKPESWSRESPSGILQFPTNAQQMLSRTDDEMDVDEDFVEGVTDEDSDGSVPNSEEDAEGEEDEENEDDARNPEETYAEKEIEGDFECAFLYNS